MRDDSAGASIIADTERGIGRELTANTSGFWQANRDGTRSNGLGLSIAKGIVEAHGQEPPAYRTLGSGLLCGG